MAIEANTPKDWGMRGATNVTLPQFKGKSRQLIINIDDGYRPIIMDGITLGGKFKSASIDELNAGLATKLDATAKAESAKIADTATASHFHTTAQVTGLDTALAGKAPKNHTHTVSQITDMPNVVLSVNNITPASGGNVNLGLHAVATSGDYNDLRNKPSSSATPKAYVTTTWGSGTSWYREWSDGWIEQGGLVTTNRVSEKVTLNKAYKDTKYHVIANFRYGGKPDQYGQCYDVTTTGFTMKTYPDETLTWYACGF